MLRSLLLIFIMLLMPHFPVLAQNVPTATTKITKDDLIAHPVGREVKELNERMRKLGEAADSYEKGSDPYNLLKSGHNDLLKKRDKVGENIKGLRDTEVVLYGDQATGNPASVKQAVIDFYIRNPGHRGARPLYAYFDKNGNGPLVRTSPPNPEDIVAEKKKTPPPVQSPQKHYGDPIVVNPVPSPYPQDDCVCILGQCPPGC